MTLANDALGRFAHRGEGGDEEVVELDAVGQLLAELDGSGAEFVVAERGDLRLEGGDGRGARGGRP